MEKHLEYAALIIGKIAELFDENNESGVFISNDEITEGKNLTHFIHALANLAPCHLFNEFTNSEKDHLEFNHIANQLVFQYSKKSSEVKEQ